MTDNIRYNTNSGGHGHSRRKRKKDYRKPVIIGLAVIVILAAVIFIIKRGGAGADESEAESQSETLDRGEIKHNACVDLSGVIKGDSGIDDDLYLNVQGMTADEISRAITGRYEWSLAVVNEHAEVGDTVKPRADIDQTTEAATLGDEDNPDSGGGGESDYSEIRVSDTIEIPDLIAERIPALIDEILAADREYRAELKAEESAESSESGDAAKGAGRKKEDKSAAAGSGESGETGESPTEKETVYKLELTGIEDEIAEIVSYASNMWFVEALGGSIGSYDSENDRFLMESSRNGFEVDEEDLSSRIGSALASKDYTARIEVTGTVLNAEDAADITGSYDTIATYTTNTSANAVRNKNIQLACEKLNGTIVRPGEEFSFNNAVGQRTREAGYGEAAAYNNGEVVQEVGGGVCQVSTTLYNAVIKAGLKITARQSHTFKPTYVTPGQDATISWGGPDFRFANLPAIAEYSYDTNYAIGIRARYADQVVTVSIYGRPVLKPGYSYSLSSEQIKIIPMERVLITPEMTDRTPAAGSDGSVWETRLIIRNGDELISNAVDHKAYYSGHTEYYLEESSSESESGIISDVPITPDGPGGPGAGPGGPGPGPGGTGAGPGGTGTGPAGTGTAPGDAGTGNTGADAPGSGYMQGDPDESDEPLPEDNIPKSKPDFGDSPSGTYSGGGSYPEIESTGPDLAGSPGGGVSSGTETPGGGLSPGSGSPGDSPGSSRQESSAEGYIVVG